MKITVQVIERTVRVNVATRNVVVKRPLSNITVNHVGRRGLQGATGPTGPQGEKGEQGVQGLQGATGPVGPKGDTGEKGEKGDKGDTGEGVPIGGTTGQVLSKASNEDYETEWVNQTGGSGAVDSVNSQTGVVVLDADDIDDSSTSHKFVTATDLTNLGNLSGTNTGDQDLSGYALSSSLADVATSGDYDDLDNKPTIPTGGVSIGDAIGDVTASRFLNVDEDGNLADNALGVFALDVPIAEGMSVLASGVSRAGWEINGMDPAFGLVDFTQIGGDYAAIVSGINDPDRTFSVEDGFGTKHFQIDGAGQMFINNDLDTPINEFSKDGTLSDNSDTALPTEKAVKTYVDTELTSHAVVESVVAGSNVTVDNTDPKNPIVSASGGGGGSSHGTWLTNIIAGMGWHRAEGSPTINGQGTQISGTFVNTGGSASELGTGLEWDIQLAAGDYAWTAMFRTNAGQGTARVYVNGVQSGSDIDQNSVSTALNVIAEGTFTIASDGKQTIRFSNSPSPITGASLNVNISTIQIRRTA